MAVGGAYSPLVGRIWAQTEDAAMWLRRDRPEGICMAVRVYTARWNVMAVDLQSLKGGGGWYSLGAGTMAAAVFVGSLGLSSSEAA